MKITEQNLEQLIQQYVLGQLQESDAEAFEVYFLSNPDIAERIELAQSLHLGLRQLDVQSSITLDSLTDDQTGVSGETGHTVWQQLQRVFVGPVPSLAMAALLVLMVPFAMQSALVSSEDVNVELVRFEASTVRSAVGADGIDLSTEGDYAALMLRVPEVAFPAYRVRVADVDNQTALWQSEDFVFKSGSRDHLVLVPPQAAKARVDVQLFGITPEGNEVAVDFCGYTEACL